MTIQPVHAVSPSYETVHPSLLTSYTEILTGRTIVRLLGYKCEDGKHTESANITQDGSEVTYQERQERHHQGHFRRSCRFQDMYSHRFHTPLRP